tara:strand:+ start:1778 stop:2074 length:297 start_codon:yes stop_codon:yes gene_type:complete
MAEKKGGITDLTKVLIDASKNFNERQYGKLQSVLFALMHGVNFGYNSMDGRFLEDSNDLFVMHKGDKVHKKLTKKDKVKYKDNVIQFKDYSKEVNYDG